MIMNPFEWHWLVRALISLVFVVPAWLSIGFFGKAYQIRGEVTALWYFLGTGIGIFILSWIFNLVPAAELLPGTYKIVMVIGSGLIFGAVTNALLFSAIASASQAGANPSIPQAIQGVSVVLVFLLSMLLASIFPKYFSVISFNPMQFIGVLLAVLGVTLVIIYK